MYFGQNIGGIMEKINITGLNDLYTLSERIQKDYAFAHINRYTISLIPQRMIIINRENKFRYIIRVYYLRLDKYNNAYLEGSHSVYYSKKNTKIIEKPPRSLKINFSGEWIVKGYYE